MTVQELLRLGRGSVIQLDRLAGEPIDIYVGDRRFAEGEVVVLGEHLGCASRASSPPATPPISRWPDDMPALPLHRRERHVPPTT